MLVAWICSPPALGDAANSCSRLRAERSNPLPTLPERKLSTSEVKEVERTRACLKSYSSGFPGGEQAFLLAPSSAVRTDLATMEQLFAKREPIRVPKTRDELHAIKKLDPQFERKWNIQGGWDRQQVLLWGHFFYARTLYTEGELEEFQQERRRIEEAFGPITVTRLSEWDSADNATYYSKASLRNMIRLLEYSVDALQIQRDPTLTRAKKRQAANKLAGLFNADRLALSPYFSVAGDPTEAILAACR